MHSTNYTEARDHLKDVMDQVEEASESRRITPEHRLV